MHVPFYPELFCGHGPTEAGLATKLLLKSDTFPMVLGRDEDSEKQALCNNASVF